MRYAYSVIAMVTLMISASAQIPKLGSSTIADIQLVGKPMVSSFAPGVYGSGLWTRGDTLFSALFSGASCAIAYSIDDAQSWKMFNFRTVTKNITSSAVSEDGRYVVLGYEDGTLEYSTDGGKRFVAVNSPTEFRISTLAVRYDGQVIMGRDKGMVFISNDGCMTWQNETMPLLYAGNSAGVINHLKYTSVNGLAVTYSELSEANTVVSKVAYRTGDSKWSIWEIPNAVATHPIGDSLLYVTNVRRIPGRYDQTCYTELYSINRETNQTKVEFTEDVSVSMSGINTVFQSPYTKEIWAISNPEIYVVKGASWYRDTLSLRSLGVSFTDAVFLKRDLAVAITMRGIIRIRFSTTAAVVDDSPNHSVVVKSGTRITVMAGSSLFDVIGVSRVTNNLDDSIEWDVDAPGLYFLRDNKSNAVTTRFLIQR